MTKVQLKYELRMPGCFGVDAEAYYKAALEQISWCDEAGIDYINFCEHHGSEDGYLPSPLPMMAAAAVRTRHVRLRGNVVLPFHDPLRIAEDVAVVDILSGGRAELVILGGYVKSEFEMFGVSPTDRGELLDLGIQTLRSAWTGNLFEYRGRSVRVTPPPVQSGGPPLFVGGGVAAAARRAARVGDGFVPMTAKAHAHYEDECRRLGKTPRVEGKIGPVFVHVSVEPERDWEMIKPHALYQANAYSKWQAEMRTDGIFYPVSDAEELRRSGLFAVLTPSQCVSLADDLGPDGTIVLDPLMGGMSPELGWKSLHAFAKWVHPELTARSGKNAPAQ